METKNLLAKYKLLEAANDHTTAASLLVDTFGAAEEKEIMRRIAAQQEKDGFINPDDYRTRNEISQKYYRRLL